METGRTPIVAMLVSLMALAFPALLGGPISSQAREEPATQEERSAQKKAKEDDKESKEPETKVKCEEHELGLQEDVCEGAFARFLTAAEGDLETAPDDLKSGCWKVPDGSTVERVVATLPDPIETGMQSTFDEALGAVIRAFSDRKFLLDRFWSPWHDACLAEGGCTGGASACSARVPAVFTFRSCPPPPLDGSQAGSCQKLELYVVGESPTSGMRRRALRLALDLAKSGKGNRVRIIGPSFSGSADSLKQALLAELAGSSSIVSLTTGTASASSVRKLMNFDVGGGKIDFASFVLSTEATRQAFFEYLRGQLLERLRTTQDSRYETPGIRSGIANPGGGTSHDSKGLTYRWFPHVAMFTEGSTTFGELSSARDTKGVMNETVPCTLLQRCNEGIVIKFPLHVGAMRVAFAKQLDANAAATESIGPIRLRPIALRPEERVTSRQDTPAQLSPETSVIEDLVLAEEARVLAEEDVRVIGLFASDPADTLFLVRQLRRRLPNARIFVFDHDFAFEHPAYQHELRGVMLVSTYPNTARADRWVFPFQETNRRMFGSPTATGTFNAALWGSAPPDERPLVIDKFVGYGTPFRAVHEGGAVLPSLWISAVGASGSLPVAVIQPGFDGYATPVVPTREPGTGATGCVVLDDNNLFAGLGWNVAAGLLSASFLIFCIGACMALYGQSLPIALRWLGLFRPPHVALGPAWRWRLMALVAVGGHFLATIPLLLLLVVPHFRAKWCSSWAVSPQVSFVSWIDLAIVVMALLAGLLFSFEVLRRDAVLRPMRVTLASLITVPTLIVSPFLCVRAWAWLSSQDPFAAAELPISYLRWTSLGSQLSPVVPALLLASLLSVAASQYLLQARLGGKHGTTTILGLFGLESLKLPDTDPRAPGCRNLEGVQRLVISCASIMRAPFLVGIGIAMFVILIVVDPVSGGFGTIERHAITVVLGVGFGIAFALTSGTLCASLTLASSLGMFLRRLDVHPLGAAVKALGVGLSDSVRLPFASLPDSKEQLRLWLSTAKDLANALPKDDSWRVVVSEERVLEMSEVSRSTDVVAALSTAFGGKPKRPKQKPQPPLPPHVVKDMLESWQDPAPAPSAVSLAKVGERLAAVQCLLFIFWAIRQLRTMAGFTSAASLLFAIAIASYPFQPARLLATIAAVFVVMTLATSIVAFVVLQRDAVLSGVAGTKEDRIEWDRSFIQQIAAWVVLPFFAFLATQYPEEIRSFFGWTAPYLPK